MSTFPRHITNPYWAAPCPVSGLIGCDVSHDPDDDTGLCDTAPHSVPAAYGSVTVSASRVVHPSGLIREIVALGATSPTGVNYEPAELSPEAARQLALILLDCADTATVTR